MGIVEALGALLTREGEEMVVRSPGIGGISARTRVIDCKESGLSMRMFAPIAALLPCETTLAATGSLLKRPMDMVADLEQLGVSCRLDHGRGPISVRGPVAGGRVSTDAGISSPVSHRAPHGPSRLRTGIEGPWFRD